MTGSAEVAILATRGGSTELLESGSRITGRRKRRCVTFAGVAALLGAVGLSSTAEAQTLKMMKSLDAPHYDGQRTTWSPTSDIVNMFQDTLVALDWDGKTAIPYLAKSWTISEDGKLYTFKLRDDVTFCSGKKFTAADVVYTFKRLTRSRDQGAATPGAPATSRSCARPIPTPSSTSSTSRSPICCCSSRCSPTRSTTRRAWSRSARTTASRRSTAPGRGASRAGSRAPRSC